MEFFLHLAPSGTISGLPPVDSSLLEALFHHVIEAGVAGGAERRFFPAGACESGVVKLTTATTAGFAAIGDLIEPVCIVSIRLASWEYKELAIRL